LVGCLPQYDLQPGGAGVQMVGNQRSGGRSWAKFWHAPPREILLGMRHFTVVDDLTTTRFVVYFDFTACNFGCSATKSGIKP
jgi:hypothetical protein